MRQRHRFLSLVLVAGLLATACSGDAEQVTGSDPEATGADASPAAEGDGDTPQASDVDRDATLTVAASFPTTQFDPHKEIHTGERPAMFLLYDRLTQINNDFEVEPMLATEWAYNDDGTSVDFTLRDDVEFNDGTPVNAEAVVFSLDRAMTVEGSTAASRLTVIDSVEAVDEYTVRINLTQPDGTLPYRLAEPAGAIVSPAAVEGGVDLSTDPEGSGSGPYQLVDYVPNESMDFERAEGEHWEDNSALVSELDIQVIPDATTRMNALQSGQVDAIFGKSGEITIGEDLGSQEGYDWYVHNGAMLQLAMFLRSTEGTPFADPLVRQAVNHAIDREPIQELAGGPDVCTPSSQPWPDNHWASDDGLGVVYPYDPERAQELLAEAGAEDLTFTMALPSGLSPQQEAAEVIQSQLAEVGLTVELLPVGAGDIVGAFVDGDAVAATHVITGKAHPTITLADFFFSFYNLFEGHDDLRTQAEELEAQGIDPAASQEEQEAAYEQISAMIAEEALYVPLCFFSYTVLAQSDVVGLEDIPWWWSGIVDLRYLGRAG